MGAKAVVARAALHMWEEPCISGESGSGAVFFSGCNLRCVYCQNRVISHERYGLEVSSGHLASLFSALQRAGAHNINLVTPTHFIPQIIEALDLLGDELTLPVVYNSSGYENPDTLRLLEGYVDVYLPDFKYADGKLSGLLSSASDYPESCRRALLEMYRQVGKYTLSPDGTMTGGLLVRHMLLPGFLENSFDVIDTLHGLLPADGILLSLMSQYTPAFFLKNAGDPPLPPSLGEAVSQSDYRRLCEYASTLGFDFYSQEHGSASEEYTPDFDLTGLYSNLT
jgi:putative pyruvate formate lyase activating enzyme